MNLAKTENMRIGNEYETPDLEIQMLSNERKVKGKSRKMEVLKHQPRGD